MPADRGKTENDSDAGSSSERPLWYGVVGAGVGAIVGFIIFYLALKYGAMYALVLPGAMIGLCRAVGTKTFSIPLGIGCGVFALALSLWIEWSFIVHPDDWGIVDFLLHLHEKPWRNVVSLIAGPLMGLWFGLGRRS